MGACMSTVKNTVKDTVGQIDKEAVEMSVKGRKVEIAQRAKNLASEWQTRIARGETVSVSPAEVLPLKDTSNIQLTLNSQTSSKDILITALYASTNTIYRDKLKKEVWQEVATGMKNSKSPISDKFQSHGESLCNPLVDVALDKHVITSMTQAIKDDMPLVSDEEIAQVRKYREEHKLNPDLQAGGASTGAPITEEKEQKEAAMLNNQSQPGQQPIGAAAGATAPITTKPGDIAPVGTVDNKEGGLYNKPDKQSSEIKTYQQPYEKNDVPMVNVSADVRKDSMTHERRETTEQQQFETNQAIRA